jgi:hypothetical protein
VSHVAVFRIHGRLTAYHIQFFFSTHIKNSTELSREDVRAREGVGGTGGPVYKILIVTAGMYNVGV